MGTRSCGHESAMSTPTKGEAGPTGQWRTTRPVVDRNKCTAAKAGKVICMQCWAYCPEAVIAKRVPIEIDLEYCKGCGICEEVCPAHAITMVPETDCQDDK